MEPLELEPSSGIQTTSDGRRQMEEPPPVRVVAVEDVRLNTPLDRAAELDDFYVRLWQFEREASETGVVYRAENVRLRFQVLPDGVIERETIRPQGIEVASLAEAEHKLIEAEREYIRQRSLTPGQESLLLQDPAGNWIEIFESRLVG